MRAAVIGFGHMGGWLARVLAPEHEVAVIDPARDSASLPPGMRLLAGAEELPAFRPQLAVNAVPLHMTVPVFRQIVPFLPAETILVDLCSVKAAAADFYRACGRPFVSLHPMFGPRFTDLLHLAQENLIVIHESQPAAAQMFLDLFRRLGLAIHHRTFAEHDAMMALSLSLPFVLSLLFAENLPPAVVPGTTFRRHLETARGVLQEDASLLAEILGNPHTVPLLEDLQEQVQRLQSMLTDRDTSTLLRHLESLPPLLPSGVEKPVNATPFPS